MQLKTYQKKVLRDLASYLSFLNADHDMEKAYRDHWTAQDVHVGLGGVPDYRNTIPGAPHVCFKVPTGGGKTYIACASVKPIFDIMPKDKPRVVAWLVPSNAILEQTIKTLSDVNHPYRQRLDFDFSGRVVVYTKEQLLNGQNFNPTTVREQLSICILSYDSLRSSKKDGRKVYQENSQLAPFTKTYTMPETLIEGIDDTALIQVLNQLSPVVIVDESHNAQSDLSVEMLQNLNPFFVLDLTATPKANSNIISYVDARDLKTENMVKLPVVVYNRIARQDVIQDAIQLRGSIEQQAISEEKAGGEYIRPIVLFQAQPRTGDDSGTFEKIKAMLIDMHIPKEQIAIKTSDINELKNIELLSRDCPIRYIITVNALKEGWDCPFAYILASLANKTSAVDVEQILGRILRQPYAKKHPSSLLNTSYVLTCSNDFRDTLERIVLGLNKAGFTRKDIRLGGDEPSETPPETPTPTTQTNLFQLPTEEDGFEDINPEEVRLVLERDPETATDISEMIEQAQKQSEEYSTELVKTEGSGLIGGELGEMINQYKIQAPYSDEVSCLKIPQFFLKTVPSLFGGEYTLLSKEALSDGFSLSGQDAKISFELATGEMYRVDISETGEAVPKYQKVSKEESEYLREYISTLPEENKVKICTDLICHNINRSDRLVASEISEYVTRIIKGMTTDELTALETAVLTYSRKIQLKIESLEAKYRETNFDRMLDSGKIVSRPSYTFPKVITPIDSISSIAKSLYDAEGNMNDFEYSVINAVIGLANIKWWHRVIERKAGEFVLNGFINHYPDFIVMTKSNVLVLIETKGDYLANDESKDKLRLGRKWQAQAGSQYRYFMVFKEKEFKLDGAYTLDEFIGILKDI